MIAKFYNETRSKLESEPRFSSQGIKNTKSNPFEVAFFVIPLGFAQPRNARTQSWARKFAQPLNPQAQPWAFTNRTQVFIPGD